MNVKKMLFFFSLYLMFSVSIFADEAGISIKVVLFPFKRAVISSLIDAKLIKYNFHEGEEFKKGDILLLFEDDFYKQDLIIANAKKNKAKSEFEYTTSIYRDNIGLFKKEAIGSQELARSKMNAIVAKASLSQAEAEFAIAKLKYERCKIIAPYSGRFTKQLVNEYEFVRRDEPIMEIIDDNKLLAKFFLPSSDLAKINIGDKIKFNIDEKTGEYIGKVYAVSGGIDQVSRTFAVEAIINNKDKKLMSGMSGSIISF